MLLSGQARAFAAAPHQFPAELALSNGGIARFRLFHRKAVAIADPELVRQVLIRQADIFQRSRSARVLRIALGDGLLSTDADLWKPARQWLEPGFRRDNLMAIVPSITKTISDELDEWFLRISASNEEMQLVPEMKSLIAKLNFRILFAEYWNDEQLNEFQHLVDDAVHQAGQLLRRPLNGPYWWPGSAAKRLRETGLRLNNLLEPVLALGGAGVAGGHLLQRMKQRKPGIHCPISQKRWLDELKTLAVAALETSTTTLTWTFDLLARHPEVCDQLTSEIDQIIGSSFPDYLQLTRLNYCENVLSESMRLWPAVYNLVREVRNPVELGGLTLARGTLVYLSIYGLHRHPGLWRAPEEFIPSRFSNHSESNPGYLPFAIGPHTCLGIHLARLQMHCIIAMILQRFRLVSLDILPTEAVGDVTLRPRLNPQIKLILR